MSVVPSTTTPIVSTPRLCPFLTVRAKLLRRSGRGCGLAAGAGDELGGEDEAAVLVLGRGVGFFQEELGGGLAEFVLGLADRGQGHGRVGGEVDVVVADDG